MKVAASGGGGSSNLLSQLRSNVNGKLGTIGKTIGIDSQINAAVSKLGDVPDVGNVSGLLNGSFDASTLLDKHADGEAGELYNKLGNGGNSESVIKEYAAKYGIETGDISKIAQDSIPSLEDENGILSSIGSDELSKEYESLGVDSLLNSNSLDDKFKEL